MSVTKAARSSATDNRAVSGSAGRAVSRRLAAAVWDWLVALVAPMFAAAVLAGALDGEGSLAGVVVALAFAAVAAVVLVYFSRGWSVGTAGMRAFGIAPIASGGGAPTRGKAVARGAIALLNAVAAYTALMLLISDEPDHTAPVTIVLVVALVLVALGCASALTLALSGRSLYDRALGFAVERTAPTRIERPWRPGRVSRRSWAVRAAVTVLVWGALLFWALACRAIEPVPASDEHLGSDSWVNSWGLIVVWLVPVVWTGYLAGRAVRGEAIGPSPRLLLAWSVGAGVALLTFFVAAAVLVGACWEHGFA